VVEENPASRGGNSKPVAHCQPFASARPCHSVDADRLVIVSFQPTRNISSDADCHRSLVFEADEGLVVCQEIQMPGQLEVLKEVLRMKHGGVVVVLLDVGLS
jgi:hypothetical protein